MESEVSLNSLVDLVREKWGISNIYKAMEIANRAKEKARDLLDFEFNDAWFAPDEYLIAINAKEDLIEFARHHKSCIQEYMTYYVEDVNDVAAALINNDFDEYANEVEDIVTNTITQRLLEAIDKCKSFS